MQRIWGLRGLICFLGILATGTGAWAQSSKGPSSRLAEAVLAEKKEEPSFRIPSNGLKEYPKDRKLNLRGKLQYEKEISSDGKSLNSEFQRRGGTNGGGGGGGVACYADEAHRDRNHLKALLTYEAWISEITRPEPDASVFLPIAPNEAPEAYLQRSLQTRLKAIAPAFLEILLRTIQEVSSQTRQCRSFAYVNDRGIHFSNEQQVLTDRNCEPVQLAWRSPVRKWAEDHWVDDFKIEFDCDLYSKLGLARGSSETKRINQALLILHEALYLMGARLGMHPDSYHIQEIAIALLLKDRPIESSVAFRYRLREHGFDEYFRLLNPSDPKLIPEMKKSRQESYHNAVVILGNLQMLFAPRGSFNTVYAAGSFSSPFYQFSFVTERRNPHRSPTFAIAFHQALIEHGIPQMTDEEAFIFWVSLIADEGRFMRSRILRSLGDFESLLLPSVDDREVIRELCANDRHRYLEDEELFQALEEKVQSYCSRAQPE